MREQAERERTFRARACQQRYGRALEKARCNRRGRRRTSGGTSAAAHLATSALCWAASRRGSVLMSTAQQGKQASKRIRIPLWRITPTRFRFPLPYVCRKTGRKSPQSSKQSRLSNDAKH